MAAPAPYGVGELAISQPLIDPANSYTDDCRPNAEVPAWWSGFLFHVLNPRQLSLYLYLCMLSRNSGVCHPTANEIRDDLNLASGTIVFDAISALERNGFILRERRVVPELNSRRNVYQRPACEYTVLRLLELGKLDGELRPPHAAKPCEETVELQREWLRTLLGDGFAAYERAPDAGKTRILSEALTAALAAAR